LILTIPEVGVRNPEIKFNMVVFPHPDGPTMHSVLPLLTAKVISDNTVILPLGVENVLVTFSKLISV
jgi:hypothetical protein